MVGGAKDDDLPVRIGELVADKYRVERFVGSGGMGFVVEATHLQLLQRVAIKFVRADTLDASSATRLLREARAAVALRSDHVARVLDVGTLPSGLPFLVMEYLEGETLAARLAREPLAVEEVLWMASQACKGLAEAHRRGIVHRDMKPANIFLARDQDGHVVTKVLDFGIAKVSDPGMAVEAELTSSEHALGTPRYMSPEQLAASSQVDARSDVWSLGVVLFECLAGEPPFARGTAYEIGAQVLAHAIPRASEKRPEVSPALDAIVARCLERDVTARYADASELLAALEGTGIAAREAVARVEAARVVSVEPSLPPTRVAPIGAPAAAPATAVMSSRPAHVALPPDDGTLRTPMQSPRLFIALAALFAIVAAGGIYGIVRAKEGRVDPPPLALLPAAEGTPDLAAATTAPTIPEPPASSASATTSAAARTPAHSASAPRRPVARPAMTRPPNER